MMELYAKSNQHSADGKPIPLERHIQDVLERVEEINKFIKEYLEIFNNNDIKSTITEALEVTALLHDVGKVLPLFQAKIGNRAILDSLEASDKMFWKLRANVPHQFFSLFPLNLKELHKLCKSTGLFQAVLSAIAYHHWREGQVEKYIFQAGLKEIAQKWIKDTKFRNWCTNILKNNLPKWNRHIDLNKLLSGEDNDVVTALCNDMCLHTLYDWVPVPYTNYLLPEHIKEGDEEKRLRILLLGFLMRADHAASASEEEGRIIKTEKAIPSCINSQRVTTYLSKKKEIAEENQWQKAIAEECKDANLTILLAPTGAGKTEFALYWGTMEKKRKCIFTLPLRTAVNAIFERTRRIFEPKKNEKAPPEWISLLHSDADLYLLRETAIEEGEIPRLLQTARQLAHPLIVTTGDQVFPAVLKFPGYEKYYSAFIGTRIIVDEVQAYDPIAMGMVVGFIKEMVRFGSKVLLMTATLPPQVKEELEKLNKQDFKVKIIDLYKGEITENGIRKDGLRKYKVCQDLVRHVVERCDGDIKESITKILAKAQDGNRVLVICNTVKKAKELYEELDKKAKELYENTHQRNDIEVDLLHSRLTLNERRKREIELEHKLNKKNKEYISKKGYILVATQVVEASLDIDADYLYTELCPIDALIQRMGRVWRRLHPFGKDFYHNQQPNVFIFGKVEESKKEKYVENASGCNGEVYEKELVIETYKNLKAGGIEEQEKQELKEQKTQELKEQEKQELVEKVFGELKNSKYIQQFTNALEVVSSGYQSDRRSDALKMFRRIHTFWLVYEANKNNIISKLKDILNNNPTYLQFKNQILSEYAINDYPPTKAGLAPLYDIIRNELEASLSQRPAQDREALLRKVEKWCKGIYVVKEEEDEKEEENTLDRQDHSFII